jgi:hypothetical protein
MFEIGTGDKGNMTNYAILHIMPDPPAKRILFFFSTNLSCNFPDSSGKADNRNI